MSINCFNIFSRYLIFVLRGSLQIEDRSQNSLGIFLCKIGLKMKKNPDKSNETLGGEGEEEEDTVLSGTVSGTERK